MQRETFKVEKFLADTICRRLSSTFITMKFTCATIFQQVLSRIAFVTVVFCMFLFMVKHVKYRRRVEEQRRRQFEEIPRPKFYPVAQSYERIDWHDVEFMKQEATRKGDGELGQAFITKLNDATGFNVEVSEKISVNRSLPDTRLAE